jgi:hypothetical protein
VDLELLEHLSILSIQSLLFYQVNQEIHLLLLIQPSRFHQLRLPVQEIH